MIYMARHRRNIRMPLEGLKDKFRSLCQLHHSSRRAVLCPHLCLLWLSAGSLHLRRHIHSCTVRRKSLHGSPCHPAGTLFLRSCFPAPEQVRSLSLSHPPFLFRMQGTLPPSLVCFRHSKNCWSMLSRRFALTFRRQGHVSSCSSTKSPCRRRCA